MLLKEPIDQYSSSLCIYEPIISIGTHKHLTNTLKIVKKEYIYKPASFKSSTLLDKLELLNSFCSKDLVKVYLTAYDCLKFTTHRNGCFCIFAMNLVNLKIL